MNPPGTKAEPTRPSGSILVNACQKGNPVLKHIKNVPWEFGEILPDFQVGQKTAVLFLRHPSPSAGMATDLQ